ncbi:hypothetical protein K439DRAFT_1075620 [Ramaria rubella]|nr:hypothetical protein K439DRAFT_1075620 [Ramaria rubella]
MMQWEKGALEGPCGGGTAEVAATKEEMGARRRAQEDPLRIMERCQAEVEALRDQLALRADELTRLRVRSRTSSSLPTSPHQRHDTLGEVLSTVRRHVLDLSTANSRRRDGGIRRPAAHAFLCRVAALEDEILQSCVHTRTRTPAHRSSSFALADSRRHSVSSTRQHMPSSLSRIHPDASAPGVRRLPPRGDDTQAKDQLGRVRGAH